MKNNTRVRFAPSPTGALHIGGLRTALFNYLFAKNNNGSFIVRIEDTDQKRFNKNSEKHIYDSLKWIGIEPDESPIHGGKYAPYKQSERIDIYKTYIQKLLDKNKAYYAFDTPEELEKLRNDEENKGSKFLYNFSNRRNLKNSISLSEDIVQKHIKNKNYVIRLKIDPNSDNITAKDEIRGYIKIPIDNIEDKILFKSDGLPSYHFANVIDDHTMQISHVIRGEEWLPSLPIHSLIYEYLNLQKPKFYHLPLILKPQGKGKLSKRDSAKLGFPIYVTNWEENNIVYKGFKESGFLNTAVLNFLSLLGWSPKNDVELFEKQDLIKNFNLSKVHLSGAKFNIEKLKWFNEQYIQQLDDSFLTNLLKNKLKSINIDYKDLDLEQIITLTKNRFTNLNDIYILNDYFFTAPKQFNQKQLKKVYKIDTPQKIQNIKNIIETTIPFKKEILEQNIKTYIHENDYKMGEIMQLIRLSLIGELKGISIFELMEIIGKFETSERFTKAKSSF